MRGTRPKGPDDVFVRPSISCCLRGADALYQALMVAAEGDDDITVRHFECLGACDIAPMASINGDYIGPLEPDDAKRIVEDLQAGRPVLEEKQLKRRPSAHPGARPMNKILFDRIDDPGPNTLAALSRRGGSPPIPTPLALT